MMSMRIYIFLLTVCFTFQMRAQQVPDWENPRVVGINKEEYHSTLTLPSGKSSCEEIVSLNGRWKFYWSPDPQSRPSDFYKNNFDVSGWVTFLYRGHGSYKVMENLFIPIGHILLRKTSPK